MTEFELNGQTYRIGKLDAFKQFHVSRKIAPIIPTLIPVFMEISKGGNIANDLSAIADLLVPFAEGIAGMSDEASEYVIGTCLTVVHRKQGKQWSAVWDAANRACMFDDVDLGVMMPLVVRVIQDNLGPFIQGLLTSQSEPAQTPA